MWIRVRRILLIMIGAVVAVLGIGGIVSSVLGYYGDHIGLIAGIVACCALLVILGGFLIRIGIRGTDKDVSDAGLL